MWSIVLIGLAVALMIGPVMLMRPSAYQTRIAKLRMLAHQKGLRVRIAQDPREGKNSSVAVYTHAWQMPTGNQADAQADSQTQDENSASRVEWKLVRQKFTHELHYCADWDWQMNARIETLNIVDQDDFKKILAELDNSIVAIESTRLGLGVYWYEKIRGQHTDQALEQAIDNLIDTSRRLMRCT